MDYFIGQGTGVIEKFNTLEEMIEYHKNMDSLKRHFCKLYDRVKNRIADGWNIYNDYDNEDKWRKWGE